MIINKLIKGKKGEFIINKLVKKCYLHNAAMIEARKKHILKMRERREADKKNHPENAVSGTKVADDIAAAVISGSEKREITPSVALEYRKKLSRDR